MPCLLFDLDGTLTDPGLGITNSVAYALERFGIQAASREALYPYIGPPLTASFQQFHGLSPQEAEQALAYYREYFRVTGMFENTLYPGMADFLAGLKGEGYTLMVATSKPEEFTNQILAHFDLARYFDFVAGNTLQEERPTKEAVIAYALAQNPAVTPESSLMIGDRKFDILGGKHFGMGTVGVLYGYGGREELEAAAPDALAADLPALLAAIHRLLPM